MTRSRKFGYVWFVVMVLVYLGLGVAFFSSPSTAPAAGKIKKNELYWCSYFAPKYGAQLEVRLDNGCRCDLVNEEYAIEADWAKKKFEAVGQALYYAMKLEKEPGILLLITDRKREAEHIQICRELCEAHDIALFEEVVTK